MIKVKLYYQKHFSVKKYVPTILAFEIQFFSAKSECSCSYNFFAEPHYKVYIYISFRITLYIIIPVVR